MRAFKVFPLSFSACLLSAVAWGLLQPGNGIRARTPRPTRSPLFNGKDLSGWEVSDFAARGQVSVENHQIIIGEGEMLTGVALTNLALVAARRSAR